MSRLHLKALTREEKLTKDAMKAITVSVEPSEGLSNGDTFTVKCTADERSDSYLISPDATLLREYVVEDMPYYIDSADQVTEDVIQVLEPGVRGKSQSRVDEAFTGRYNFFKLEWISP